MGKWILPLRALCSMLRDALPMLLSPFSSSPKRRLKKIQYRTTVINLIISILGVLSSMTILFSALFYFYQYTYLHRLVLDTRYSAKLREMSDRIRFTDSDIAFDYQDVERVVKGIELNYPPVFGNTDVVILRGKMRTRSEADASRKHHAEAAKVTKPTSPRIDSKRHRDDDDDDSEEEQKKKKKTGLWGAFKPKSTANECICQCPGLAPLKVRRSLLPVPNGREAVDMATPGQKQDHRQVTIYQIDSCSLDRRDEVDYLITTVTLLKHLQGVPGVPFLLDFFQDRLDNADAGIDTSASFIYATVAPFLSTQLQNVQFNSDSDAINALVQAIRSMDAVHRRKVVLLNASPKTIYIEHGKVYFEPPPAGLLIDDNGLFTLPQGMVLPKMATPLVPGAQHTPNIDFILLLDTFRTVGLDKATERRLKEASRSLSNKERMHVKVEAEAVIRMVLGRDPPQSHSIKRHGAKSHGAQRRTGIQYQVIQRVISVPFVKDEQDKLAECTVPVYGYLLKSFHKHSDAKLDHMAGR